MKKQILILFAFLAVLTNLSAQEDIDSTQFLFNKFQDGSVYYKDGRVYNARLNYHLRGNCFLFIDANDDNVIKEFGEVNQISAVKVADKSFLLQNDGSAYEVIQFDPMIAVKYIGRFKKEGKNSGYGGRSETGSIDAFSSIRNNGETHSLPTGKYILIGIDNAYLIEKEGKRKSFRTEKQFLKLYPKHTDELQKYIEEKKVKLNDVEQMAELIRYANTLKP